LSRIRPWSLCLLGALAGCARGFPGAVRLPRTVVARVDGAFGHEQVEHAAHGAVGGRRREVGHDVGDGGLAEAVDDVQDLLLAPGQALVLRVRHACLLFP